MTPPAPYKEAFLSYIESFNAGDLDGILSLFTPDAHIYSPTQPEPKTPGDFYPGLLERSKGSRFQFKTAFTGEQKNTAAMLFDYNKKTADGTVTFDCIDICTFDQDGKITEMRIIFDTKKLGL